MKKAEELLALQRAKDLEFKYALVMFGKVMVRMDRTTGATWWMNHLPSGPAWTPIAEADLRGRSNGG